MSKQIPVEDEIALRAFVEVVQRYQYERSMKMTPLELANLIADVLDGKPVRRTWAIRWPLYRVWRPL